MAEACSSGSERGSLAHRSLIGPKVITYVGDAWRPEPGIRVERRKVRLACHTLLLRDAVTARTTGFGPGPKLVSE